MSKKIVSVALAASTLVWGLGIATLPLANAQSTADLQAQIAALLAQIQQLQSQLNSAQGGSSTSMTYDFTSDLTVGSTGAQVSSLQQLLISKGYLAISAPTGYFGPLTQTALGKFQAANGIAPAAGYFGPKTRAFVNAMSSGSTTGGSTGGSTSVTPPSTGLSVSVSSQNPGAGSLVTTASGVDTTSAARIPVLAINFTASNSGAVTVTDLKVHKNGVLSDSSINGAYLIQNGQVLYQYTSLNQGVIDFSGMNLSVPAGQTVTLWVGIDPASGLSAGNTVSFSVNSATDITAFDANNNSLTPSGVFPINGSTFTATTVSSPAIAGLTITTSSVVTQITAGTQNNIVGAWQFSGRNSATWLKGIKLTVIGSASMGDIRNVKLYVNGTQVGQTLSTVPSTGFAYFDLSSAPATVNTGNNNVQVYADVMGSPNKNFQFEVLNSYDVNAVDSQYNVPVAVTLTSGSDAQISIQNGQITVSQDSGTPTGNIANGQSGVTLAKFDVYAAGEPVKVKFLGFQLALAGVATTTNFTTIGQFLRNVSLVDDAGGQVGSTINTPPSTGVASCDIGTPAGFTTAGLSGESSAINSATVTYVDCFGNSTSPINYIIPANTTRVLSLKADIQSLTSPATFSSITASLLSETNNLQGLISSQAASGSGATGSALTLQSSLLTTSKNVAYGNQTATPNSTGIHIGSYAFTASSASGITINTVSIQPLPGRTAATDVQNLRVMINGTQFGNEYGVITDGQTYAFSGSPFTVTAGGTTYVDVYADVLSNATTTSATSASSLTACSGTSVVSYSAVSCSGTIAGQNLTVSSAGATVSVGLDSSAPAASNLVMGSTGNTLAAFRLTETTNVENVKITDLTVTQNTASSTNLAGYNNVTLYNGATAIATAGSASGTSAGYVYKFHFSAPPVVPQNGTLVLTLKGDVASYNSNGASDNSTSTFAIATSTDVTALGQSSNIAATLSGLPATGNTMTVLRTTLTPSATVLGNQTSRVKSSVDNLANITLTANNAGSAMLRVLTLTFGGNAVTSTVATSSFVLRDANNVNVTSASSFNAVQSGSACSANSCVVTWTFPTSTTPLVISAGGSYSLTLQTNDSNFATASGSASVSLSASIQANTDMTYYDNSTATGSTISLPTTLAPLSITNITFASGT